MTTLVIGASTNPMRYSYMAIEKLNYYKHSVLALGLKPGIVAGIEIKTEYEQWKDIDTITLYLNPKNQEEHYNSILALKPRRVLFNPGTENPFFEELLHKNNILTEQACTLVLLDTGQY